MPRDPRRFPLDDRLRMQHMLDASRHVVLFITDRSRSDLDNDPMLVRALMNAVQEIGEAAARISEAGRDRAPEVPWGQIVAMRHVLVHVYWGVDRDRLWKTATDDVPVLVKALEQATADWPLREAPEA
ncbi:MAG: HepT-like ribonuclease domain-containing protein [Planctomycetota bacterium]|nr:HepT-like ribonuclease domain-containing protein [Planctomycetota bacterium]